MALALAPHGIRVNAVGPGSIMTDVLQSVVGDAEAMKKVLGRTPLLRVGDPLEIGNVSGGGSGARGSRGPGPQAAAAAAAAAHRGPRLLGADRQVSRKRRRLIHDRSNRIRGRRKNGSELYRAGARLTRGPLGWLRALGHPLSSGGVVCVNIVVLDRKYYEYQDRQSPFQRPREAKAPS